MLKEMQKKRALECLANMEKTLALAPRIRQNFESGELDCSLFYSYFGNAYLMKVSCDEMMRGIVEDFESKYHALVYHCMLGLDGLVMLYIGEETDNDCYFIREGDTIVYSAVYNIYDCFLDFGYVKLGSHCGLPIRVG